MFNLRNTFEIFVVDKFFNPLFLYGGTELGKPKWLQAEPCPAAVMSRNCHKGDLGSSREFFTVSPFWKEP